MSLIDLFHHNVFFQFTFGWQRENYENFLLIFIPLMAFIIRSMRTTCLQLVMGDEKIILLRKQRTLLICNSGHGICSNRYFQLTKLLLHISFNVSFNLFCLSFPIIRTNLRVTRRAKKVQALDLLIWLLTLSERLQ